MLLMATILLGVFVRPMSRVLVGGYHDDKVDVDLVLWPKVYPEP
jgi:hypothetical protein